MPTHAHTQTPPHTHAHTHTHTRTQTHIHPPPTHTHNHTHSRLTASSSGRRLSDCATRGWCRSAAPRSPTRLTRHRTRPRARRRHSHARERWLPSVRRGSAAGAVGSSRETAVAAAAATVTAESSGGARSWTVAIWRRPRGTGRRPRGCSPFAARFPRGECGSLRSAPSWLTPLPPRQPLRSPRPPLAALPTTPTGGALELEAGARRGCRSRRWRSGCLLSRQGEVLRIRRARSWSSTSPRSTSSSSSTRSVVSCATSATPPSSARRRWRRGWRCRQRREQASGRLSCGRTRRRCTGLAPPRATRRRPCSRRFFSRGSRPGAGGARRARAQRVAQRRRGG
ncbi:hypothetical protein T492DRAFT_1053765, partial [Pavlovales sp. CCMP2436]